MKLTCGLLPSPDILDIPECKGEDKTDTLKDYLKVWEFVDGIDPQPWIPQSKDEIYKLIRQGKTIEKLQFGPLVNAAYKLAFDPLRMSSDEEEIILFYYAGHGLSQENVNEDLTVAERAKSPVPEMPGLTEGYFTDADQYLKTGQLKEGALYLHHRGFCDLRGLLRPFIAALEHNTQQGQPKKNKHLLIVVDSCYSGVFAKDLEEMKNNEELKRWLDNGCSITVQASSGYNEPTFGGYFTPCFVQLNERHRRDELLKEWNKPGRQEILENFAEDLPTPTFVTTREIEHNSNPFLEICTGDSTITLFNDPDFFKFCFIKLENNGFSVPRTLSPPQCEHFLKQSSYTIIDFKLKKMRDGDFKGTPMGLFLVVNPADQNKAVCVHVHYAKPNEPKKFKLFEHEKDRSLYEQVGDGSKLFDASKAGSLISKCKEFVEQQIQSILLAGTDFESWWIDVNNWSTKGKDHGHCKLFRKQLRTKWIRKALSKRASLI